jgi:hypothetical protein
MRFGRFSCKKIYMNMKNIFDALFFHLGMCALSVYEYDRNQIFFVRRAVIQWKNGLKKVLQAVYDVSFYALGLLRMGNNDIRQMSSAMKPRTAIKKEKHCNRHT